MKLLTAAAMRELDRRTIEETGLPGAVLMENAGRGAAGIIMARFAELFPGPVAVFCGRGNNGGDGFVVARHLREAGWTVEVFLLAERADVTGDAALMLKCFAASGGEVTAVADPRQVTALASGRAYALCVDAIFGTGLGRKPEGLAAAAVDWLNCQPAPVVALDLPTGVDADTGRIPGRAVKASLTVTFAFPKVGLYSYPGAACAGEVISVPIGIPGVIAGSAPDKVLLVDAGEARTRLPRRPLDGHKGTFGHLLAVAGSPGKSGAAALTATAGLRGGAGLVTLGCPGAVQAAVAAQVPEVMTAVLEEESGALCAAAAPALAALCAGKQALAVGPGLGTADGTGDLVRQLLAGSELPAVVDADALNHLAGHLDVLAARAGRATILTPHPGEMARLCGRDTAEIQADRLRIARDFARTHGVVLVLKGARTLTAVPDGRVFINATGNAGMASGGMGDVLTGLIGALLAQGLPAEDAAVLGTYLHGLAGDRLAARMGCAGLLAGDLLTELPAARQSLA